MTNDFHTFKHNYTMFGFQNFQDFKTSFFGTWYKELVFAISIIIGYAYWGADIILEKSNFYFYNPSSALFMTLTIILIDWAVAVYGAVITKTFETKKAQRIIPMLAANFLLLTGLFNIKKYIIIPLNMELVTGSFQFFMYFTAFYLSAVHFLSGVTNAGRIGLIDGKVVKFVMDYVDKKKQEIQDNLK